MSVGKALGHSEAADRQQSLRRSSDRSHTSHLSQVWQDKHELLPGEELYDRIAEGVRITDRVLLFCSRSSLSPGTGWWVDREIAVALQKEKQREIEGKLGKVLIPVDVDGFLFSDECVNKHSEDIRTRVAARLSQPDRARELDRILMALRPRKSSVFPKLKF